jgi:hypothetical protein
MTKISDKSAATPVVAKEEPTSVATKQPILPPLASGLPQKWESIAPGNMILAFEGPGEGYWEAIVIERQGDILTLRNHRSECDRWRHSE